MRKQIGNNNKEARDAAVTAIKTFSGKKIKNLNTNEVKDLLLVIMQLLGLPDKDGNIK